MPPRLRRILVRLAVLVVAGAVVLWGGLNLLLQTPPARRPVQAALAGVFGPEVRFGRVWWFPWSGFVVHDFEVPATGEAAAHGPFLHIDRVEVRPNYGALRHGMIMPRSVRVLNPALRVVRSVDGRWLVPMRSREPAALPALAAAGPSATSPAGGPPGIVETTAPVPPSQPGSVAAGPPALSPGPAVPPVTLPVAGSGPPVPVPPPDIRFEVVGASLDVIDEGRPGSPALAVRGGGAVVSPAGGRVTVGAGDIELLGTRGSGRVEIPLAWVGSELQAAIVRRASGDSSLGITAAVSLSQGLPVSLGIEARKAPPSWFAEWAGFDLGGHWQGASVTMATTSAALAKSPGVWGSVGQAEIDAEDLPAFVQALWQSMDVPGLARLDGRFTAQAQWVGRNGVVNVPRFQVMAGGILFGGRAALGPERSIQGEAVAALGPDVRDGVRKLEDRLPPDLAFHFDQAQEVVLPDGRKESWPARPLALTGRFPHPRVGLWMGYPPVTLSEIRDTVSARRRPPDRDSVELLPIRASTGTAP